jgi:hypothetical protein
MPPPNPESFPGNSLWGKRCVALQGYALFAVRVHSSPFVVPIRGLDPFLPAISNYLGEEDPVVSRNERAYAGAYRRTS